MVALFVRVGKEKEDEKARKEREEEKEEERAGKGKAEGNGQGRGRAKRKAKLKGKDKDKGRGKGKEGAGARRRAQLLRWSCSISSKAIEIFTAQLALELKVTGKSSLRFHTAIRSSPPCEAVHKSPPQC